MMIIKKLLFCFALIMGPLWGFAQMKPLKAMADSENGVYKLNKTDTAKEQYFTEPKEAPIEMIGYTNGIVKAKYNGKIVYIDRHHVIPSLEATAWLDKSDELWYRPIYLKRVRLYGKAIADAYGEGNVLIGMPFSMVVEIKGSPDDLRRVTTAKSTRAFATYTKFRDRPITYYFVDYVLKSIAE